MSTSRRKSVPVARSLNKVGDLGLLVCFVGQKPACEVLEGRLGGSTLPEEQLGLANHQLGLIDEAAVGQA